MADGFDEGDLRAAQPRVDSLARDNVRAEVAQRLFGTVSEPHRLGRFAILERLGHGGMGVVYSAYDPVLDRRVALKLLQPRPGPDVERMRARLHREAQALARLSHPNVVPVYDVGILGHEVFIVMEFVVGQTLRAWAPGRAWHEVLAAYLQAARGLAAAHAVGLVHRDVKPDNVMVGEDGRVRVVDFGLVRDFGPEPEPTPALGAAWDRAGTDAPHARAEAATTGDHGALDTLTLTPAGVAPHVGWAEPADEVPDAGRVPEQLTATAAIMGTPAYMAPEQLRGAGIGPSSDQFSFCVALCETLYDQHPFVREDLAALVAEARALRAVMPEGGRDLVYPAPREPPARSSIPPAMWPILRRGLAADPAQRWPSMEALIEAFSARLAQYDGALAQPGVHRLQRLSTVTLGVIGVFGLGSVIYTSSRGMADDVFTPRASLMVTLGAFLIGLGCLGYVRMRWKPVEYLRRLLEHLVVFQGGVLLNDVVGLWLGRPLYQTIVSNLVMIAAVSALASLLFARWMAWLLLMDLAALALCLLIPAYHLVFFVSVLVFSPFVVLSAWNRRKRQLGGPPPASRRSARDA